MKTDKYITMDTQLKNWRTNNSWHDILKFQMIHRYRGQHICKETYDLKISSLLKVYHAFPSVRFYGFHSSAKEFGVKNYDWDAEDYENNCGIPDGYLFSKDCGIFIIEIENTSRVTSKRLDDYLAWWTQFDGYKSTPLYIIEFNRFGEFQRDVIKESFDKRPSVEILDQACKKLHKEM